jgi:hypothetical protein
MVAAGVIPIDRLTEMRAPVEVVAHRAGRCAGPARPDTISLPPPAAEAPSAARPPAAALPCSIAPAAAAAAAAAEGRALAPCRASPTRLTHTPCRQQLEAVYGFRLPRPAPHEPPQRPPNAAELLRAFAVVRGWVAGSGLPDETKAGRQILKDYVGGGAAVPIIVLPPMPIAPPPGSAARWRRCLPCAPQPRRCGRAPCRSSRGTWCCR